MTTKNYRGRFGPEDAGRRTRPRRRRTISTMEQTKHKAITAWIASTVALVAAFGFATPDFFTSSTVDWLITALLAAIGGGGVGWLTWLIPNKPVPTR